MTENAAQFRPDYRSRREDLPDDYNDLPETDRARLSEERCRLLHIFAQSMWHSPASIVGNRNGLLVLRDAIDAAMASGKAETSAMVADGEGYSVEIELNEASWQSPAWETMGMPYVDPIARGEPDPAWDIARLRQALRQANAMLVKRGVKPIADPLAEEDNFP